MGGLGKLFDVASPSKKRSPQKRTTYICGQCEDIAAFPHVHVDYDCSAIEIIVMYVGCLYAPPSSVIISVMLV